MGRKSELVNRKVNDLAFALPVIHGRSVCSGSYSVRRACMVSMGQSIVFL
jgi:hypothetical protein